MNENVERELGWEDEIEKDGESWITLPEGDYNFTVTGFERGRHSGSDKLPPCNKAIVNIKIEAPQGSVTIKHNLFLHSKNEGLLCAFFTGIGQRKHGEKLKMNWNAIVGAKGHARVGVREWKSKNGDTMRSNEIKKFYDPDDMMLAPKYEVGRF